MPCNFHLRGLAEHIKEGVRDAGGTPMEFNTIAISDGITMGTEGMKTSLVSREVIADSIELVGARLPVRRPGRALGLRQDDSRRGDGAGAARHPGGDALRRLDRARAAGTARTSPSSTCSRRSARTPRARCPTRSCARSRTSPAPAPAPAAASSPPTRWPAPSRRSGSRPAGSAMVPAEDVRQGRASPSGSASW